MVTSDAGKFYLKVEKGRKPRIQLFEKLRNAQVSVVSFILSKQNFNNY